MPIMIAAPHESDARLEDTMSAADIPGSTPQVSGEEAGVQLTKDEEAALAKEPPPSLADSIAHGAIVYTRTAKTVEELAELALFRTYERDDLPAVVKRIAKDNAKLAEDVRLDETAVVALASTASTQLAAGYSAARSAALAQKQLAAAVAAAAAVVPRSPEEAKAAAELAAEGRRILNQEDPLGYAVKTFSLDHVGDTVGAELCAISYASRNVKNSRGIHILATGGSGKGKSDVFDTFGKQLPDNARLTGRFTDKSLYYKGNDGSLKPSTVLTFDDKDFSEVLSEILKEATSDFRKPIYLHTMTTDRQPITIQIPERCVFWVAKVEGAGDDQIQNRLANFWIDDSEPQDRAVVARFTEEEARDDDTDPSEVRPEVRVARAMWEAFDGDGLMDVSLSRFVRRIEFGSVRNRRNARMFYDMIKAMARLRAGQRDRRTLANGTVRIYATVEDFGTAERIFNSLHGECGGQETHCTRAEQQLLDVIYKAGIDRFSIGTLQPYTNLSESQLRKLIEGEKAHGGPKSSGLLDKVPFIALEDASRSESVRVPDPDGYGDNPQKTVTRGRRAKVYRFDRAKCAVWQKGLAVWLNPEHKKPENGPNSQTGDNATPAKFGDIPATVVAEISTPLKGAETGTEEGEEEERERCEVSATSRAQTPPLSGECVSPGRGADGLRDPCDHAPSHDSEGDLLECRGNSGEQESRPPISDWSENLAAYGDGDSRCRSPDVAGVASNPDSRSEPAIRISRKLNPTDYVRLPKGYMIENCACDCGSRVVLYKEKPHATRARGPGATTHRICADCYERAKACEAAAITSLPGVIEYAEIVKVDNPERFGRCSVCNLGRVAYQHAASRTVLCQSCYGRIVREAVDIR